MRRHADALHAALAGKKLAVVTARTKAAKAWLAELPNSFVGQKVEWVKSRGKNLVGQTSGGLFWYSHLMMWGRWQIFDAPPETIDKRERARIGADDGTTAILFSAPVFEVGESPTHNPFIGHPYLRVLGPDILPYSGEGDFDDAEFRTRLCTPENAAREIGAVLLDQNILAGVGNYLRAEMLWVCQIDPFATVAGLTGGELDCLSAAIPEIAKRAYELGGQSVTHEDREKMRSDRAYIYAKGSDEWGTRHYAFRRTNLPCLRCGEKIKQKRQFTRQLEDGTEKERIIYFCPNCQKVV